MSARRSDSRASRVLAPLVGVVLLLLSSHGNRSHASDEVPGAEPKHPIALVNGTIHTATRAPFTGTVIIEGERIVAVGESVQLPAGARSLDVKGKHVYPGLFDAFTNLGLVEINSIRATRDETETGAFNPSVKSWVALQPDSELIPVTRANGVLLALSSPTGSTLAGKAAVIQLDGWTWEDLILRQEPDRISAGLYVEWPTTPSPGAGDVPERVQELERLFELARRDRATRAAGRNPPVDATLGSLAPVLEGVEPLIVRAERAAEIEAATAFAVRYGAKLIVHGGWDAPHCADLLRRHGIPVIVGGVYRQPRRRSEPYDSAYTLPERLRQAGIAFAISSTGRFGASNVRNLPYHAATAVAFGLPAEDALRAITISPARILGVADRVGSIETGKHATLFVASGDILETASQVEHAFVRGREIELTSRHTRLHEKYSERLDRAGVK